MQKRSKTTERDVVGVEGGKEKAKKAVTVENKVTPATVKKAGGSKKAVTVEKKVTATTVKKGKESKKAVTVNKKVAGLYKSGKTRVLGYWPQYCLQLKFTPDGTVYYKLAHDETEFIELPVMRRLAPSDPTLNQLYLETRHIMRVTKNVTIILGIQH